jgi:hypothetical protein
MSTITFDTLKFAKKLEAAGMAIKEAEALAEAQNDAFGEMVNMSELATKKDLALSDAALRKDLAEMKYDLLKWIIGLALAQFALLISILLKLPH